MRFLAVVTFILSITLGTAIVSSPQGIAYAEKTHYSAAEKKAVKKLRNAGFSKKFIDFVLSEYDKSTRDEIVALNVLGFLSKAADYEAHFSARAVRKTSQFLKENKTLLKKAQKRYGVEPELIASLLWVETKHGDYLGRYPVAGVYFSLLQADHPSIISITRKELAKRKKKPTQEDRLKVKTRSKEKARWALEELQAVYKIYKNDPKTAKKLKGSFAGAFGIPQFLPSSYNRWAKSSNPKRSPDLFKTSDAIYSVGYYLKKHGYQSSQLAAQREALFQYNRAEGYVNVILKLANCFEPAKSTSQRKLASSPSAACSGT